MKPKLKNKVKVDQSEESEEGMNTAKKPIYSLEISSFRRPFSSINC